MDKLTEPHQNTNVPDEVLAQTLGYRERWHIDGYGRLYDERMVFVARSLEDAAGVMRSQRMFVPTEADATGINWSRVPAQGQIADLVRRLSRS